VEVRLESLTTSSMTTRHTYRHGSAVLVEGRVRHVCVDQQTWTKSPWPDALRTAFTPLLT
jgi:acyl-CoA thioester hydrolase